MRSLILIGKSERVWRTHLTKMWVAKAAGRWRKGLSGGGCHLEWSCLKETGKAGTLGPHTVTDFYLYILRFTNGSVCLWDDTTNYCFNTPTHLLIWNMHLMRNEIIMQDEIWMLGEAQRDGKAGVHGGVERLWALAVLLGCRRSGCKSYVQDGFLNEVVAQLPRHPVEF